MTVAVPERESSLKEIQTAVRHMAVYGVGNILVKVLGFLMIPFYTHYLTPKDYGVLEILDLSMSLLGLVLNMGLTPALLRCYAGENTPEGKQRVISTGCVFGTVVGVGTFFIGLTLTRTVTGLLFGSSVPPSYLLLSFTALILSFVSNPPRTYLRALEASGTFTLIDTIGIFLLLGLNVFFIAWMKIGLAGVLWSSVIVGALQCVLLSAWTFRRVGWSFVWPHFVQIMHFGAPLLFGNVGLFVLNFSDRFFLQHLRNLDEVGIYALGYKFGFMLNYLLVQPFFIMWQSRMYSIHKQPHHRQVFRDIFSFYSLGLVYACLAMALFSPEVVRLMIDPAFAAAQTIIPVVAFSYVFYGLSYYAQLGLFLTDKTGRVGIIGAGTAVANIGLNYLLISWLGMMGAALATLVSFALLTAASYWQSQRALPMPLGMGRMFCGMLMGCAFYAAFRWWNPAGAGAAVAVKTAILLVFPVAVWRMRILPRSAAEMITSAKDQAMGVLSARFSGKMAGSAVGQ